MYSSGLEYIVRGNYSHHSYPQVNYFSKKNKIVIISGIGTREYFRKFGYGLEGPYMVKRV